MNSKFSVHQIPDTTLLFALKRAQNFAEVAFDVIYNRYRVYLHTVASGMLKNEEEAKDIVQEVFIVLWTSRLNMIVPDNDLNKFLKIAVKRRCIDILRKRKTREKHASYINSTLRTFTNNNPLENKEMAFYMQQALLTLPEKR